MYAQHDDFFENNRPKYNTPSIHFNSDLYYDRSMQGKFFGFFMNIFCLLINKYFHLLQNKALQGNLSGENVLEQIIVRNNQQE